MYFCVCLGLGECVGVGVDVGVGASECELVRAIVCARKRAFNREWENVEKPKVILRLMFTVISNLCFLWHYNKLDAKTSFSLPHSLPLSCPRTRTHTNTHTLSLSPWSLTSDWVEHKSVTSSRARRHRRYEFNEQEDKEQWMNLTGRPEVRDLVMLTRQIIDVVLIGKEFRP